MQKRIISILALTLFLFGILLGCEEKKNPVETTEKVSPTETENTQINWVDNMATESVAEENGEAQAETEEELVPETTEEELVLETTENKIEIEDPEETTQKETVPTETEEWTLPEEMTPFG